jgi:hypothetical protein
VLKLFVSFLGRALPIRSKPGQKGDGCRSLPERLAAAFLAPWLFSRLRLHSTYIRTLLCPSPEHTFRWIRSPLRILLHPNFERSMNSGQPGTYREIELYIHTF